MGYEPGAQKPATATNQRNGHSAKKVLTSDGPLHLQIPRDRDSSFEPILIPKHERRFTGFDDKIIAMYARGMTVRAIQAFLQEQYGTEVSPEFISSVTDADGRGACLAESSTRTDVSGGLLRRFAGKNPRRWLGT
ncbi:transposase-like protein [Robbsia andropogonis]